MGEKLNQELTEYVGSVKLDYSSFFEVDNPDDGLASELLSVVKNYDEDTYGEVIDKKQDADYLINLSKLRENVVSWIPFSKEDKVLEVGAGYGAVTGAYLRKAGFVVSCEKSKEKSLVNAHRHKKYKNLEIRVGDFFELEKNLPDDFSYICVTELSDEICSFISSKGGLDLFIKKLKSHLAVNGRLVLAVNNKYGLRYFAGYAEEHLGRTFESIENYPNIGIQRAVSSQKVRNSLKEAGFSEYGFYFPYPDCVFTSTLYSEKRLPGKDEILNSTRNFKHEGLSLFDEKKAVAGCLEEGVYETFANSFLVVTGKEFDTTYVRFSNDRDDKYCIRTEVREKKGSGEGKSNYVVAKIPETPEAKEHIGSLSLKEKILDERYKNCNIELNKCDVIDEPGDYRAEFKFEDGKPLSDLLDERLLENDDQGFQNLFNEYVKRISGSDDFEYSDYDLIFSNILVNGTKWTLIDYEWTFPTKISARESALRALYVYLREEPSREGSIVQKALLGLRATSEDFRSFEKAEADFQQAVNGNHKTLGEFYSDFGKGKIEIQDAINVSLESGNNKRQIQFYEDFGDGFSEEKSFFAKTQYDSIGEVTLSQAFDEKVKILRIDPCMDCCIVEISDCRINGKEFPLLNRKAFYTNGKQLRNRNIAVFPTEDPNLYFSMKGIKLLKTNIIEINIKVTFISKEVAGAMADAVKRFI